jgi:hypothetical protein
VLIGLTVAGDVRLRLTGSVRCLHAAHRRILVAFFEAPLARAVFAFRARKLRIVLPKLFLGRCDDPIIVFGVLIVILRSDWVA